MRQKFFLSVFLLIIGDSSLIAQYKYDFPQFRNETWSFMKQPGTWNGTDWLKVGMMSVGSFLLIETADQPVRDLALSDRRYLKSVPIEAGRIWGELYSPVVLFAGFAAHSVITKDNSTRKVAYEIGQAALYTGGITYILKTVIGRARPDMNEGTMSFSPFTFDGDDHSFPSGHTAVAFTLSTVLSRNARPTWLKILAYVPTAITPISRIYEDRHWISSCFFGGALAYFVTTWVVDHHKQAASGTQAVPLIPLSVTIALD